MEYNEKRKNLLAPNTGSTFPSAHKIKDESTARVKKTGLINKNINKAKIATFAIILFAFATMLFLINAFTPIGPRIASELFLNNQVYNKTIDYISTNAFDENVYDLVSAQNVKDSIAEASHNMTYETGWPVIDGKNAYVPIALKGSYFSIKDSVENSINYGHYSIYKDYFEKIDAGSSRLAEDISFGSDAYAKTFVLVATRCGIFWCIEKDRNSDLGDFYNRYPILETAKEFKELTRSYDFKSFKQIDDIKYLEWRYGLSDKDSSYYEEIVEKINNNTLSISEFTNTVIAYSRNKYPCISDKINESTDVWDNKIFIASLGLDFEKTYYALCRLG